MGTEREGSTWLADLDRVPIYAVGLLLVVLLLVVAVVGQATEPAETHAARPPVTASSPTLPTALPTGPPTGLPTGQSEQSPVTPSPSATGRATLPGGGTQVFGPGKFLVAYYGTAGTGSLGVLGEASPEAIMPRLARAAKDFAIGGRKVQPVFELIVRVAHAGPTSTGAYSSDIDHAQVQRYIDAAHRHGVLVVLDLQPGRANFLPVARRWAWALKDPWVGLALDPEWRVGPGQRPAQVIGSVTAKEVNSVSRWLEELTVRERLPQKIFMLHQFRVSMVQHPELVVPRDHLALVQHVDGFGPPTAKLDTFRAVARPQQFTLGFKLFYDEDVPRMSPAAVLRIRPRVRFVSFQ